MTNGQEKQKTLEERTQNTLRSINGLIDYANEAHKNNNYAEATYYLSLSKHEQNRITIDYLQEIYTGLKK
ncbi:MAG: hypothetical protein AABX44_01610 [Nanoarchaeota archaeon]